jgi:transposase
MAGIRAGDKGTTVHRKANGAAYLYSVKSYWDKEKKQARNRQVCLGRLNGETGEVIPSTRKQPAAKSAEVSGHVVASTKVYGPHLLLSKIAEDTGLTLILKECFPHIYDEILSLAFFIAQKGIALSRCRTWSVSHAHPLEKPIESQRVSELLQQMTENDRQLFLSRWLNKLSESEVLCYDITSISSYASANEYVRFGHNRDKESLPQINLAMLFGQVSGMPAYYRRTPGNISDVVTLENTIKTLEFLGKTRLYFVLDRGFYSKGNVDALLNKRYHFALAVPTGRTWVRDIIDQYFETVVSPAHYRQAGEDEVLYMVSHLHKWGKRRCYAHLYYNATRAAEDCDKLIKKLVQCKEELESKKHQAHNLEYYDRFFVVEQTPKHGLSVKYNDAEIQKYRKRYAGFFCILTNRKTDSGQLLEAYRKRDVVENCFDDLKNSLDMKRLRIHSSTTMDSRLFIQFIALILICRLRAVARLATQNKKLRFMTVREIMEAMECIVRITYSGRRGGTISEIAPLQRDIINAFGLQLRS